MRNSILKSYLKKFIRSEAFISVIIVFLLAIGIIGTSYALYMDVDTDTDYQLVEVGDLSVGFDNGDNTFTLNYLTPTDDDIATGKIDSDIAKEISQNNLFSFYIYNNGTYTANYNIKLVPQSGSISSEYLRYQICKDNIENCKDIKTLSEAENSIIFNDELSPNRTETQTNPSAYYFLRVWVSSEYADKVSENDKVVLKVEIEAKNVSGYLDNDNTLVGKLLSDERVKINNTVPKFGGIADYVETGNKDSGELGLFKAEDDYGISYYYRGAQSYNYVNFAGHTWRVVRINGDGSIRLVLNYMGDTSSFAQLSCSVGAKCTGYMYGENSDEYNILHENINDSYLKKSIDIWYENSLLPNYIEYLSDNIFCGDKTFVGDGVSFTTQSLKSFVRLTSSKPTLECAKGVSNNLSRYTVEKYSTEKNVETNGDLKYPIATLSSDEVIMAGAVSQKENDDFYLYVSSQYWWTMSSTESFSGNASRSILYTGNKLTTEWNTYGQGVYYNRPVINLKSDVLYANGDGTKETPYEIK